MQNEDGKWRVEFDEPWAKEGAKPPEPEDENAAGGALTPSGVAAAAIARAEGDDTAAA